MTWTCLTAAILLTGCSHPAASLEQPSTRPTADPVVGFGPELAQTSTDAKRVLVVINTASSDSKEVGQHYVKQREIPHGNVVFVTTTLEERMTTKEYYEGLEKPVREKIKVLKQKPDFIVLTKGVPIKSWDKITMSTDAMLAAMDQARPPVTDFKDESQVRKCLNPYYGKDEPFSSSKYGFYLVTRLDGYTVEDAKALVGNSLSAKPAKGPFLIDIDPGRIKPGYSSMHETLVSATQVLRKKGFEVEVDETNKFVSGSKPVMGYASWGSNDGNYLLSAYKSIMFLPGAIGETFVSTSARTFLPVTSGQSVISDLIHSGITGIKGYVDEPYTFALAHPDILFDRYTSGHTLAESFYMASTMLKWKDIVIGDPICRPYKPVTSGSR